MQYSTGRCAKQRVLRQLLEVDLQLVKAEHVRLPHFSSTTTGNQEGSR
jgi:hypothetical protein